VLNKQKPLANGLSTPTLTFGCYNRHPMSMRVSVGVAVHNCPSLETPPLELIPRRDVSVNHAPIYIYREMHARAFVRLGSLHTFGASHATGGLQRGVKGVKGGTVGSIPQPCTRDY
jgi:hypothetical protein